MEDYENDHEFKLQKKCIVRKGFLNQEYRHSN